MGLFLQPLFLVLSYSSTNTEDTKVEETVTEEIEGSSDIVLDAEASDTTTEGESAE